MSSQVKFVIKKRRFNQDFDQEVPVQDPAPESIFPDSTLGDEVKLEPQNEDSRNFQTNSDQEVKRQTSTSNDDYEIVSTNSKSASVGSEEKDKTPTPPEIQISPVATVAIDIPEPQTPTNSVKLDEEDTGAGAVQPAVEGIWNRILSWIQGFANWVKWVIGL